MADHLGLDGQLWEESIFFLENGGDAIGFLAEGTDYSV